MYKDKFQAVGARVPRICMPNKNIDLQKWAVVACDQFTSEPEYWNDVEKTVDDAPSTLHLVLPEIYLEAPDSERRIDGIHAAMNEYLEQGILEEREEAVHLVRRKPLGAVERWGMLLCMDLEQYDYSKDASSMIRATEGTIIERIPPRLRIRKQAAVEVPHILVLIDDPEKVVIEPLIKYLDQCEKIYDVPLMKNGGELTGYRVSSPVLLDRTANGLNLLAGPILETPEKRILYAVGDGNHSLATAKAYWEEIKEANFNDPDIMEHPARWALVEIENIHDHGLVFEPIHRVVFNADIPVMESSFSKVCASWEFRPASDAAEVMNMIGHGIEDGHVVGYADEQRMGCYIFHGPKPSIPAATLQEALDEYLSEDKNAGVDYIHGDGSALQLGRKKGNCAFFLPAIDKYTFFRTIEIDGALPRKTFSMGEATEKRYYLESRRIT